MPAMQWASISIRVSTLWIRAIDLCLSLFLWAKFHGVKAAVRMHTLLDLHGNIPTLIRVTSGDLHDVNILDETVPEAGTFYVMAAATSILIVSMSSRARRYSSWYAAKPMSCSSGAIRIP
jgi:hypothetical protein